jgi:hypothetical protein
MELANILQMGLYFFILLLLALYLGGRNNK